jgi:uncharacterized protein YkwD
MMNSSFFRKGLFVTALFMAVPVFSPRAKAATAYQNQLLRLHNAEREKRNLPRLRFHGALNRAASRYARLMDSTDHFDHTGPDGSTFDQRILAAGGSGFTTMGENIAFGQRTPVEVTRAWMASPGHRRNILNRNFRLVGFGKAGGEPYWVTNFAG